MGTNKTFSQPSRRRRIHAPQFKAKLVAICQQPGISMTTTALDHGINANLLRRWVLEHERYGKHSLPDDGDAAPVAQTRDMSPANWIPLSPPLGTADHQAVARASDKIIDAQQSAQAHGTITLELAAQGLQMTLRWPGEDRRGLAGFVRELLT